MSLGGGAALRARVDRTAPSPLRSPPSEREGRAPLEPLLVQLRGSAAGRSASSGGDDAARHARGGAAVRGAKVEGAARRSSRDAAGDASATAASTPAAMSATRVAAPAARASSAASAKLKVCGPITTGQPHAAASIRFWPPSGAKLPPSRATSASAYQAGISSIESPSQTSAPAASGGGASPSRRCAATARSRSPRSARRPPRSAADGAARRPAAGAARRRRAKPRAASPPRLRASTRRRRRRAPSPARQARPRASSAGVGGDVVLEVADDADVANAGVAQPRGVGVGLRQRRGQALERRPQQARRRARRGAGCARSCARWRAGPARRAPRRRRAGSARSRSPSARRPPDRRGAGSGGRRRAVSNGSQSCASPSRSSAWPAARPVAVPWVSRMRTPGRAARKASSSGAAARVSPSETACTQTAPGAHRPR